MTIVRNFYKDNEEKAEELRKTALPNPLPDGYGMWLRSTDVDEVLIKMAEWKDEQHSKEKQQWIEKACEWLKDNIYDYYTTGDGGDEFEGWFDDMFEDFKKAMEEQL